MAEPLTLAGVLATTVVNVFSGGVHQRIERWLEHWRKAAIDPSTGLPRNPDIEEAGRAALRSALEVLVLELAGRIEPGKGWLQRAADRFNQWAAALPAGDLLTSDLFPRTTDPYRLWLDALRRAVRSDKLKALHRWQKFDASRLRQYLGEGEACRALDPGLADAVLEWARHHVTDGLEHPDFESLVREGWDLPEKPAGPEAAPLSRGLADKGVTFQPPPARRITLAHAYCLFFREHLKANPKVFNVFAGDTLVTMQRNLDALGRDLSADLKALREQVAGLAQNPPSFTAFEAWLTPQLGAINDLLAGVKDDLDALARGQRELKEHQGEILATITALRTEVVRGHPDAPAALADLSSHLARFERKLDHLIGGLPIQRFQVPDPPTRELELLHAKHRAVALLGRGTDLDALCSWVESAEPISARLLVGGAGTGKTRLAFELLLRVAAALPGWQAGLLGGAELRRLVERTHAPDLNWPAPTLLVVDYALTLAGPLAGLLRELTFKRAGLPPLRLLLLERQAGEWFDDLLRQEDGKMPCPVRVLFHPPAPVPLTPLPPGELRREMLKQTLAKAASLNPRPPLQLPPPGNADFDQSLARDLFDQPLNLMLAALAASELGLLDALKRPKDELVFYLAEREERRLSLSLPKEKDDPDWPTVRHLAACATICSGLEQSEFHEVAVQEANALDYRSRDGSDSLFRILLKTLPNTRPHRVAGVLPDLVGEAFVYRVFSRELSESAHYGCIQRLASRLGDRVLAFVLRALLDFPAPEFSTLAAWLALIQEALSKQGTDVPTLLKAEVLRSKRPADSLRAQLLESFEAKASALGNSVALSSTKTWLQRNINLAIAS